MRSWQLLVVAVTGLILLGAGAPEPPVATPHAHEFHEFDQLRVDPYYWLRERENPEVLSYLQAENDYLDAVMASAQPLQEELFAEIVGRIKKDDASVPYLARGYYYYSRYVPEGEYPLYCRKQGSVEAPEEILLDSNALAAGHNYFATRGRAVSAHNDVIAVAVDTVGRRKYTIRFKNLSSGEFYPEAIPEVTGNMAWAEDNRTLFYTRQDPQTLRSYQIYRHVLGSDPDADELVFQEDDETFSCHVTKTRSRRYLLIVSDQTTMREYRYLAADTPAGHFQIFQPRTPDLEYFVDHIGDRFLVRTNLEAKNFKLMETPLTATGKENWRDLVPHREEVLLEDVDLFRDYMVLSERSGGLVRLRVVPWSGESWASESWADAGGHEIDFGEPTYSVRTTDNHEINSDVLRYRYSSLTTPGSTYAYDLKSREKTLLKRDEVVGDFSPENYVTESRHATAADGVLVPISLVYRRDLDREDGAPCLLYGYGSYGYSAGAYFRAPVLSLLDRGFVFAVAHVRGGEEMGRWWYEDGKLLNKKNTFTDFIACGRYLTEAGYADPQRLYALGGSAGGLLVGAVINMAPELWHGAIAQVPFVDVVTTMLDDDIPLTTSEYDEWGDPHDRTYYDYMLSYSPYDNVVAQDYPHLLVTTGLHDSQVQYFEPAKWVAKLRVVKTGDQLLIMHTNMEAGHGGASGRFKRHHETARAYAFVLRLAEGMD